MKQKTLQAVLRTLAAAPVESDGELLRRHLAGEEEAFAELVRRHGRLVWSVCRNLTRSDAEADDAFQATFLVLLKNAGKIRDAGRLSSWLHGVAYRVCSKARLARSRRQSRERAAAVSERNGQAVADSAWDRTLSVVHDEVGQLPENLRVPFVLCCLEGKSVTEAADQLGWKLGTLSGRLTRAKDALIARLDARGLTVGAIAALGLSAPPAAALARATALAKVGLAIPISILQLSQGVIGMSTFSFKVLAAGVLVACGLGVTAGTGWVPSAGAQPPPPSKAPATNVDPNAEVKRLQAELDQARLAAEAAKNALVQEYAKDPKYLAEALQQSLAQSHQKFADAMLVQAAQQRDPKETYTAKTTKWEYDFVVVSDMDQTRFMKFLQDRENRGWEYSGLTRYRHEGNMADIWVFRRPAKGASEYSQMLNQYYNRLAETQKPPTGYQELADFYSRAKSTTATRRPVEQAKSADARAIEAEIAKLQEQLAKLNAKTARPRLLIEKKDLPLSPEETTSVLLKLASRKFKEGRYTITPTQTGITVEGDKQVTDWVAEMVKTLSKQ